MVSTTRGLRYNRQAMVIAVALFVLALTLLFGNASSTPATAAPTSQTPTQPTPTARPILLTDLVPDLKQAGVQYFPATGHTLRGAFLDYWNRYGGLAQFGYPLTEEFFEPVGADNKMYQVQYFERNRFELHPENKGTQFEVLLGVLGRDFRQQDPPAAPLPAPAVYFQETGHNLSEAFKQYWDTHGGLFVHGYPITEPAMERSTNGKEYLVQWFERSRFELHPENASSPYEVLLGVLGVQLSEKKGFPYGWYPLAGRAVDFSWVAGEHILNRVCVLPVCSCTFTGVPPEHERLVEPIGDIWFAANQAGQVRVGLFYVLFGRLATSRDPKQICPSQGYIVERIQRNPAP